MIGPVDGLPADFDYFWMEVQSEAENAPLNFVRVKSDYERQGFEIDLIEFEGIEGKTIHCWFAHPVGQAPLRSFLWIPPYGRESARPDVYGTRDGLASLSFNFHGLGAFHQEKYTPERGYFSEGVGSPTSWVFRAMYQNAVLAARVLQVQPEVDPGRIAAMGMSQGAGMAIWMGAWCPIVKAICADMPFLGNMGKTIQQKVYRYPTKELTDYISGEDAKRDRVIRTLAYYDTVNLATRCRKPTQISLGLKDPAARPESVEAIYNALPGKKLLRTYDWGHDWFEPMIGNNRSWLLDNLL